MSISTSLSVGRALSHCGMRAVLSLDMEREIQDIACNRSACRAAMGYGQVVRGHRREAKELCEHGAQPTRISRAYSQIERWRCWRSGCRRCVRGSDARNLPSDSCGM
jgi:hypothetical protein